MKARMSVALLIMDISPLALAQRAGPAQRQQQFDEIAAADRRGLAVHAHLEEGREWVEARARAEL
jgi:hypothetical protein